MVLHGMGGNCGVCGQDMSSGVPLSYRKPCVIVVMRSEGSVGGGKADW